MDMILNQYKIFTSTRWNDRYQLLTIHMSRDKNTGCPRLELSSLFVPFTKGF